ncbi:hypothetical protein GPECTOR_34g744 [Gonium pectorale]|uniref:Formyl transferase C-terminal domain-containing protein n=1 Tax=Gonium pectorale TaxID=33097 RepID=A0A150GDC3_GONPE|nr:hypothetical protein GPECTOR_34g744 [Gonium pectorale]|eukprot:KXZ47585.1 hypothetical protein GPECTOR_34g744 [Gonium pectorale]
MFGVPFPFLGVAAVAAAAAEPPPSPPLGVCLAAGPSSPAPDGPLPPGPAVSCTSQAACLEVLFSNASCVTAAEAGSGADVTYTYCPVCLAWGAGRGCPKRPDAGDRMGHVCSGDRFLGVLPGPGAARVVGATAKRDGWAPGWDGRYCQWARWAPDSSTTALYFSVKDGSGACREAGAPPLDATLAGLSASCQGPRTVDGSRAGPPPDSATCLAAGPYSPAPDGPLPPGPAVSCTSQAACLEVLFSNASCVTAAEAGSGADVTYTYCPVCLAWGAGRGCPKRPDAGDRMGHVCSGDRFLGVLPGPGAARVVGATAKRDGWAPGWGGRYCQWARWAPGNPTTVLYFSVKDGSGACREAGAPPLDATLAGLSASCQGPRTVAAGVLRQLLEASQQPGAAFEVCMVVSQPGKPRGRGNRAVALPSPVEALARDSGLLPPEDVLCPARASEDEGQVTHAAKLSREEGLLDFSSSPAAALHNRVRAFAGWPGTSARLLLRDEATGAAEPLEIKVVATRLPRGGASAAAAAAAPAAAAGGGGGVELSFSGDALLVPCAGGSVLEVTQVQPPTKKAMPARDFRNGLRGKTLLLPAA